MPESDLADADLLAAHDLELPAGFDPRLVTAERAPRLGGTPVTTPLLATH